MTPAAPLFVGIDIGAHAIQIATSTGHNENMHLDGDWPGYLGRLLGTRPIVALEPTGRHYSAPIVRVLDSLNALILQVDHATTKRYRLAHVSTHKTDALDAETLMLIARDHLAGQHVRGVKLYDAEAEALTVALRSTIDAYLKIDTERTRTRNRLKQLTYHVWPALSAKLDTYLRAIQAGAVTPAQLRELAAECQAPPYPELYEHHSSRGALRWLVAQLPDALTMPPLFDQLISEQAHHLAVTEAQKEIFGPRLDQLIYQPAIAQTTVLWETVPSSGSLSIATLHAAAHCQADTLSDGQLAATLGFYPQQRASGSSSSSKQQMFGYKPARRMLHLWAMALLSPNERPNPVSDYNDRLKARNHPHAFQATRAKLLAILSGIARSGEPCRWAKDDVH